MIATFGFPSSRHSDPLDDNVRKAMSWIAAHCQEVANAHMDMAHKAEMLMDCFLDNRRFRTGLRTFARHNRRAAWQHLEMARRAEAAMQTGCNDFDLTDAVPS